jgi:hypothetical protein
MSSADRGQASAPPPPTPPPPVESFDEELEDDETSGNVLDPARDAKCMADAEEEAEKEQTAHTMFDAEME